MHAEYSLTYIGIFGYKEWNSSHLSAMALGLSILGAAEGYGEDALPSKYLSFLKVNV